jgi:hypothetical protein
MSLDELNVVIETKEIEITVDDVLGTNIETQPDVIVIAAGNVGAPGDPGAQGPPGVPGDTVIPAGTRILSNKFLAGDAQPSFRLMGDGKLEWGPGGATVPDVNLFRSSADVIKTDDNIVAAQNIAARIGVAAQTAIGNYGPSGVAGIVFGASSDVNLYRAGANVLKTDDALVSAYEIYLEQSGNRTGFINASGAANPNTYLGLYYDTPNNRAMLSALSGGVAWRDVAIAPMASVQVRQIYFGTADANYDVNLYRGGANILFTDDAFQSASTLYALAGGGTSEVIIGFDGGSLKAAILFGGDVNLYRSAANILKTDDTFVVATGVTLSRFASAAGGRSDFFSDLRINPTASGTPFQILYVAEPQLRFSINQSGMISWGSGAAVPDVNLYRSNQDYLSTDDNFTSSANIFARYGTSEVIRIGNNGGIWFGSAEDTNIYRGGADTLATDDDFVLRMGGNYQIHLTRTGAPGGYPGMIMYASGSEKFRIDATALGGTLTWLSDVNLYRGAANVLRTDDAFVARAVTVSPLSAVGNAVLEIWVSGEANRRMFFNDTGVMWWGPGPTVQDTNLYRNDVNVLKTDGAFIANTGMYSGSTIYLGSGGINYDVNLYRGGANMLKTDDALAIAGAFIDLFSQGDSPTAPANPVGSIARIFVDRLAGKTRLCVRFQSGGAFVLATEA